MIERTAKLIEATCVKCGHKMITNAYKARFGKPICKQCSDLTAKKAPYGPNSRAYNKREKKW